MTSVATERMAQETSPKPKLGILAGGGLLPHQLLGACAEEGREAFVLGFRESVGAEDFIGVEHALVRIGAVGEALERLRDSGAQEVVLAGSIRRPSLLSLKPDRVASKLLARMGGALFSGDDALLSLLVRFLEEEGFRVVGVQDVMEGLLAPEGLLGAHPIPEPAKADMHAGIVAARSLGRQDAGQAVIAAGGAIIGREDSEGTNALIARSGADARGGVLVKARKPQQEMRADLPSIGPETVRRAQEAGLSGIAVEAGNALVLAREETVKAADQLGLFLYGFSDADLR